MDVPLPRLSSHHIQRRRTAITMLLVLAAALQLAAGVGLAYVAGFASVRAVLGHFQWPWIAAMAGALGISFAGYYYAYEGIFTVAGGPSIKNAQMRTVVTVGWPRPVVTGRIHRAATKVAVPERSAECALVRLSGRWSSIPAASSPGTWCRPIDLAAAPAALAWFPSLSGCGAPARPRGPDLRRRPGPGLNAVVPRRAPELGVRATFFLVGDSARSYGSRPPRAPAAATSSPVHGWTSPSPLAVIPVRAEVRGLRRASETIAVLTGTLAHCYRPPYRI